MAFLGNITGGAAGNNLLLNIGNAAQQALGEIFDSIKDKHGIERNDFFPIEEEVSLTPVFKNVRFLMTDPSRGKTQWRDTQMIGNLYPIRVKDIGSPIVVLRMYGVDEAGLERDVIMEYELPYNFKYQKNLTDTLSAVRFPKLKQALGFMFKKTADRERFDQYLDELSKDLLFDARRIKAMNFVAADYKTDQNKAKMALAEDIDFD